MPALTAALLIAGTLLSLAGLGLFTLVWLAPGATDHQSLLGLRRVATTGRWATAAGLLLYAGAGRGASPLVLDGLLLAALAMAATFATKASPAGRRPRPEGYPAPAAYGGAYWPP